MRYNRRVRIQTHMRAVQQAAEIAGGVTSLAAYLQVSPMMIAAWVQGATDVPAAVFLRIVDIIVEHEGGRIRGAIPLSEVDTFKHRQAANT